MKLLTFAGINMVERTGDIVTDASTLLLSHGKSATWRHVQAVANECVHLSAFFNLNETQCRLAGILHDISAVVPAQEMLHYAQEHNFPLDKAEIDHPFLLHQQMSAIIAQECFDVDNAAVLRAISCHTTLRPLATDLDMALFLADKIAWDQSGEPPFLSSVKEALRISLKHACRVYIDFVMKNGMILQPHHNLLAARKWLSEN
ncbi:MAG: bis(5'-nucleosyl)-tetraphosphatase (symmetrical) YqeK [Clostridia bacterium]|nr:bis(5'-nucleosyl)-tetraphosphatase (symmetrical) YqeK [Clostridia bacterium]